MKTGRVRRLAWTLILCFLFLLSAGCQTADPPAEAAAPAPAPSAPAPSQPPETPEEETVYVPSYEVYPPSMDPLYTRCAVEREDGLWFLRQVEDQGEMYYALMHGGRDAADPVTVSAFDPGVYVEWFCLMGNDRAWVERLDFLTWETALLELSLESGEILREVPFPTECGLILGLFDLPDGSLGISTASLSTG